VVRPFQPIEIWCYDGVLDAHVMSLPRSMPSGCKPVTDSVASKDRRLTGGKLLESFPPPLDCLPVL